MMQRIVGTAIAGGVALGETFLCNEQELLIPNYIVSVEDIELEIQRFAAACERASDELKRIKRESQLATQEQLNAILDMQILMLQDQHLLQSIEQDTKATHQNVESIVAKHFEKMIHKLKQSNHPLMHDRVVDLEDLLYRLLRHLTDGREGEYQITDLNEPAILVAYDMPPSLAMNLNKQLVKGVILENGGRTSHTAILIRALGIPAVFNAKGVHAIINERTPLIIDGNEGIVIVHPNQPTTRAYEQAINFEASNQLYYQRLTSELSHTMDGTVITLRANAQSLEDAKSAALVNAAGIGLFRSEFIFLSQKDYTVLTEERQYHIYRELLKQFPNDSVTVRTLDIGADKRLEQFVHYEEENPLLGWRATRLCIEEQALLRQQIRALYRASVHGRLKILIPFISAESELQEVLKIMQEVRQELKSKGIAYREDVAIGIMIETPAAVLIGEQLGRLVDFFSIGTNDLTQYTLAVDRDNPKVAHYYKPMHKSVLKLIAMTIEAAKASNTSVSLCGELASELIAVPLLLGMGLRELSVSPALLTQIKEVIRLTQIKEAQMIADNVFKTTRTTEIVALLKEYRERIFARKNY